MKLLLLLLLTYSSVSYSAEKLNSGFCVRLEDELVIENSIVTVAENVFNHFYPLDHNFFDFESGGLNIYFTDWGGTVELIKLSKPVDGYKNLAFFKANSHYLKFDPMIVKCKAL